MTIKKFIIRRAQLFFFLVTMILIAHIIVGNAVAPDTSLSYTNLLSPLIMAGLCIIPTFVTYSKKELSVRQVIVRQILQLVLIEGVVLTIATLSRDINSDNFGILLLFAAITFIIYILAVLISWYQQYLQSKKLTEQLQLLQMRK